MYPSVLVNKAWPLYVSFSEGGVVSVKDIHSDEGVAYVPASTNEGNVTSLKVSYNAGGVASLPVSFSEESMLSPKKKKKEGVASTSASREAWPCCSSDLVK